jgi:hypothetical protein
MCRVLVVGDINITIKELLKSERVVFIEKISTAKDYLQSNKTDMIVMQNMLIDGKAIDIIKWGCENKTITENTRVIVLGNMEHCKEIDEIGACIFPSLKESYELLREIISEAKEDRKGKTGLYLMSRLETMASQVKHARALLENALKKD